jgi:PTEN induced putative kinase 1
LSSGGQGQRCGPNITRSASLAILPSAASNPLQALKNGFAHRFLVDSVLRRVTNTQAARLRRKTAKQLFSGQSAPFLALLGVSLASGTGIVTKEDEVECVCSEIRQAASKVGLGDVRVDQKHSPPPTTTSSEESSTVTGLADLEIGSVIAKGCNAVVFAASWAGKKVRELSDGFEHIEGISEEDPRAMEVAESSEEVDSFVAVNEETETKIADKRDRHPLAVKMMFNYEAESNAFAILNVMHRETVPARHVHMADDRILEWSQNLQSRKKKLSPHPNIVEMTVAFTDYVPDVREAMMHYPDALPRR